MINQIKLRRKVKKKKPNFLMQDYYKRKKLKRKLRWNRPRGHHSKLRRKEKQKGRMPSPGFRSPRKIRGFHPSGLKIKLVSNISDLKDIKENQGIMIRNVGQKKKLEIINYAFKNKIEILNLRKPAEFIEKVKKDIEAKKQERLKKEKKLEKKKEEKKKEVKKEEEKKEEKKEEIKTLEKKMEKSIQVKKAQLRDKK